MSSIFGWIQGRFRGIGAVAFALGMLLLPAVAQATPITVDSTADNLTGCTLRNAIKAANLNTPQGTCPAGQPSPTVDTIDFSVPSGSTIALSSALDPINDALDVTGPGQGQLTVSGGDAVQPFKVNSGKTVSISGLRISHGKCDSVACNFAGGAISNDGTLTLSGVRVAQSTAHASGTDGFAEGGGIFNAGTMTIQSSTVTGNTASVSGGGSIPAAQGGGIDNDGTMTIQSSTVAGNTVSASGGGGIPVADGGGVLSGGTMTIQNSIVSGNTANVSGGTEAIAVAGGVDNGGTMHVMLSSVTGNSTTASGGTQNLPSGGGIVNSSGSDLTIDRSTVSGNDVNADAAGGNQADGFGGGIENHHNLTIIRSTVSGNTVSATGGAINEGTDGGIFNINPGSPADVTVRLIRSTLSDNTATVAGGTSQAGGMSINSGTYTIRSSTIAHNSAGSGANLVLGGTPDFTNTIVTDPEGGGTNCNGSPPASSSYSISSDGSCGFTGTGDHLNTDPKLAASLAANGGPTATYALLAGSPAIDAGKSSAGETVDQRGEKRPSDFGNIANAPGGDGSDIGAFEVQDTAPPDTIINSGPTATTNDPTPSFSFHSSEAGSTFRCKVDGGAFAPCTSPKTTVHLGDGPHSFQVRAKDLAGNIDASPAFRSFTVRTAAVSRSGSTLVVTAAPGAMDNFRIAKPTASTIRITDFPSGPYTGSGLHAVSGSSCTRSGDRTANCNASGITRVRIGAGALTDRIANSTSLPSALNGGGASDVLVGGFGNDTLNGGTAADTFKGMNGNDTLLGRDLASDALINCDGGTKPGAADRADLDLLPKDPNSIVLDCETKTRH